MEVDYDVITGPFTQFLRRIAKYDPPPSILIRVNANDRTVKEKIFFC